MLSADLKLRYRIGRYGRHGDLRPYARALCPDGRLGSDHRQELGFAGNDVDHASLALAVGRMVALHE
jgi:hypothetical protein